MQCYLKVRSLDSFYGVVLPFIFATESKENYLDGAF